MSISNRPPQPRLLGAPGPAEAAGGFLAPGSSSARSLPSSEGGGFATAAAAFAAFGCLGFLTEEEEESVAKAAQSPRAIEAAWAARAAAEASTSGRPAGRARARGRVALFFFFFFFFFFFPLSRLRERKGGEEVRQSRASSVECRARRKDDRGDRLLPRAAPRQACRGQGHHPRRRSCSWCRSGPRRCGRLGRSARWHRISMLDSNRSSSIHRSPRKGFSLPRSDKRGCSQAKAQRLTRRRDWDRRVQVWEGKRKK